MAKTQDVQDQTNEDAADVSDEVKPLYTVPGMTMTWETDDDGVTAITIRGEHTVTIREMPTKDGMMYASEAFRKPKVSVFRDAVKAAGVATMNAVFVAAWDRENPKIAKSVAALTRENDELRREIEAIKAAALAAAMQQTTQAA